MRQENFKKNTLKFNSNLENSAESQGRRVTANI